nr:putative ribonuclease H-like domain-containing protein [Tanacetum cinerariifolium]
MQQLNLPLIDFKCPRPDELPLMVLFPISCVPTSVCDSDRSLKLKSLKLKSLKEESLKPRSLKEVMSDCDPNFSSIVPTVNRKFPRVPRVPTVNREFPTADMGNKGTAVKVSACWIWKPTQNLSNKDERRIVIRNKARLVAQGHTQEEGIDYDEVFSPVARIEAIRLFLAYASFMGFIDPEFPARLYKVEKAMYGLHQAPRAWHQVTPTECHLHAVKRIFRYLKGHPKLGLWYPKESPFDLVAYSNSNYGGATQDRKSTNKGSQFLGRRLISWQYKKQTIMATSTTEAGYVATASGCGQVLWIQNQLRDYGLSMLCEALSKEISSSILLLTVPLFPSMLVTMGKGSGTPTEPHHTPSPEAQQTSPTATSSPSLPPVTTATIPIVIPTDTPQLRQCTRSARIAYDSTPRVNSLAANEGKDRDGGDAEPYRKDATIKGRRLETREEAASLLTSGVQVSVPPAAEVTTVSIPPGGEIPTISVPTGSGMVPTASPIYTTATESTPYTRRK